MAEAAEISAAPCACCKVLATVDGCCMWSRAESIHLRLGPCSGTDIGRRVSTTDACGSRPGPTLGNSLRIRRRRQSCSRRRRGYRLVHRRIRQDRNSKSDERPSNHRRSRALGIFPATSICSPAGPSIVTGVARGKTSLLCVPGSQLRSMLNRVPSLGEKLMTAFTHRRDLLSQLGTLGLRVVGPGRCRDTNTCANFSIKTSFPSPGTIQQPRRGKPLSPRWARRGRLQ